MYEKVYLETHGCQMNTHDSEKAATTLLSAGYEQTATPAEADLILLNTCMVREKPEQKVFKRIDFLKRGQKNTRFGVMGCVAQAEAERIFERSREVSLVIGTQSIGQLPVLLQELDNGYPRAIDVRLEKDAPFFEHDVLTRTSAARASLSITEGCNKFCSYCIVPFTRGRERSRPASSILREAQRLAAQNYREIQLLGQNVNSYGLSGRYRGSVPLHAPKSEPEAITFAALLKLLAEESGIPRIKYMTSYPRDFDAEIIRVMDTYENLCEWVHLPAQSGSDRILKLMRRGYTRREYLNKIDIIKAGRRDYAITGDIIVGFPGETVEDFKQTLALIAEVEYDGLFVFEYSARPHTAASAYPETLDKSLKTERLMEVIGLQAEIQKRRYERKIGTIVEVLVEGVSAKSQEEWAGHTSCQKTVNFPKGAAQIGEIVRVQITAAGKNSLKGKLV